MSLEFEVIGGKPIVIRVRSVDGRDYIVRAALAVLDVEQQSGLGPDGLPIFEVRGGLTLETRLDEGGKP